MQHLTHDTRPSDSKAIIKDDDARASRPFAVLRDLPPLDVVEDLSNKILDVSQDSDGQTNTIVKCLVRKWTIIQDTSSFTALRSSVNGGNPLSGDNVSENERSSSPTAPAGANSAAEKSKDEKEQDDFSSAASFDSNDAVDRLSIEQDLIQRAMKEAVPVQWQHRMEYSQSGRFSVSFSWPKLQSSRVQAPRLLMVQTRGKHEAISHDIGQNLLSIKLCPNIELRHHLVFGVPFEAFAHSKIKASRRKHGPSLSPSLKIIEVLGHLCRFMLDFVPWLEGLKQRIHYADTVEIQRNFAAIDAIDRLLRSITTSSIDLRVYSRSGWFSRRISELEWDAEVANNEFDPRTHYIEVETSADDADHIVIDYSKAS